MTSLKDQFRYNFNAISVEITGPSVNTVFWLEPTECISPDAQHCAGSEASLLSNKSELKDDENHIFVV